MSTTNLQPSPADERRAFLEARRSGLGGSDIAAVLGLSPYATPLDVYLSKIEPVSDADAAIDNEPMLWGRLLEDVIAREFSERTKRKVQRVRTQLRHPSHAFAIANIDRAIVPDGSRAYIGTAKQGREGMLCGAESLLEVKTASAFKAEAWGDDDAPDIPVQYAAQGMWYLGVTQLPSVQFACLIGGQRLVLRTLERDDEFIAYMLDEAARFWREHVQRREPPPPRSPDDVLRMFPQHLGGKTVEVGNDAAMRMAVLRAFEARDALRAAMTRYDAAADELKLAFGNAEAMTLGGERVATWKATKDTETIDWQAVATAVMQDARDGVLLSQTLSDYAARFTCRNPGTRRFLLRTVPSRN